MTEVVERRLTALNEAKLRIYGEPVKGSKRSPWIGVSVFRNNPRLEVQTNVENDKNFGFINGNMDSGSFFMLLEVLKWVIAHDGKVQRRVPNKTGPINEIVDASAIFVGKDDEGCVYISVIDVDNERPKIKFIFTPSNYHTLTDETGGALTRAEISQFYAAGWAELMGKLIPAVLGNHYDPPPPREDKSKWQGNKGGGGYNKPKWQGNKGGGGNNYQRPNNSNSSDVDDNWSGDDFPM